jgi:hypothetical protein
MERVATHTLIAWYTHPDTHPVVVSSTRKELEKRGFEVDERDDRSIA